MGAPHVNYGYSARMAADCITLIIDGRTCPDWRFTAIASWQGAARRLQSWDHEVDMERVQVEVNGVRRALRRLLRKRGEQQSIDGHGRVLFDILFPLELKRMLRARAGILTIHGDFGVSIPWGLLHDGNVALGRRWAVGRLAGSASSQTRHASNESRMLIVADPAGDLPAARFEGEALVRTHSERADGQLCDLRLGRLRKHDFIRMLGRYEILHFAGHEDPPEEHSDGGWRFSDGHIDPKDIATIKGGPCPRLVFANACASDSEELAFQFVRSGVEHFIGTLVDLPDLGGAEFAESFYRELSAGHSIGQAFMSACNDAVSRSDPVWMAYTLTGDPHTQYFRKRPLEQLPTGVRRAAVVAIWAPELPDGLDEFCEQYGAWRTAVREIVRGHGGRLLPGLTPILRAIFGVPVSYENDLVRAARACLAIVEHTPDARVYLAEADVMLAGVDVHSAALHRIHDKRPREPGVSLSGHAKRMLGLRAVLADEQSNGDARLVELQDAETVADRALIGRQDELDWLHQRIGARSQTTADSPAVALVMGAAGIGKSHLVHGFAAQARDAVKAVTGAAAAYESSLPYRPFAMIARTLLGLSDDAEADQARRAIDSLFERDASSGRPIGLRAVSIDWLLDEALPQPTADEQVVPLMVLLGYAVETPLEHDDQLASAFLYLLNHFGDRQPLLVILEDVHWLPPEGLRIISYLIAELDRERVRLLITARPGVTEALDLWTRGGLVDRLQLGSLDRRSAEALIAQTAGRLSSESCQSILLRAEGNPLYLRELALSVANLGAGIGASLPMTIEGVVQARLDRINPKLGAAIQACAVLGRVFTLGGLAALLGGAKRASDSALALEQQGFIQTRARTGGRQASLTFEHGLLHEVTYRGIDAQSRRTLHARAALWRMDNLRDNHPEDLADAGRHFLASGDVSRAADAYLRAGYNAEESSSNALAVECFQAALASLDAGEPVLVAADVSKASAATAKALSRMGALTEADGYWEQALEYLQGEPVTRAGYLHRRAEVQESLGRLARTRELVLEATRLLEGLQSLEAMRVRYDLARYGAWLKYVEGDLNGAASEFDVLLRQSETDLKAVLGSRLMGEESRHTDSVIIMVRQVFLMKH